MGTVVMVSLMRELRYLWLIAMATAALTACGLTGAGVQELPEPPPAASGSEDILQGPPRRRLMPGELVLAATREDFPTVILERGNFLSAGQAEAEWNDAEAVIGVALEGEARAYPVPLLSLVEVVNDVVGGQEIAVTWCPLCFTAIVFDRRVDGQTLTFGVSGYLYKNNLVMFDHQSETLWSQAIGEALKGAHRGERLTAVPSTFTSVGEWKALHPQSLVLSAEGILSAGVEAIDPYSGYYLSGAAGIAGRENEDDRLPTKTQVVGLAVGEDAMAYPVAEVRAVGWVEDTLSGVPVILVYRPETSSVAAFTRNSSAGRLTFKQDGAGGSVVDFETGSRWDLSRGIAESGPLAGTQLTAINTPMIFWFAWVDLYPHTGVYLSPAES